MIRPEQKEKYKNIGCLEQAMNDPLFGSDGGNPHSPVWFCALEWGQGFTDNKCTVETFIEKRHIHLEIPKLKDLLNGYDPYNEKKTKSKIYHAYVMLLTAIIDEGKLSSNQSEELWNLVNNYKFFSDGHYGFLLNAYILPLKTHTWDKLSQIVVKDPDIEKDIKFDEWTGLNSFSEYRKWNTDERRKGFCKWRKQYRPKLIYCGGISDANHFFSIWTDDKDIKAPVEEKYFPLSNGKRMRLQYQWITDENCNDTLLAVGYSFSSSRASSCLGANLERCKAVGNFLRKECERHFGNNFAWLDRKSFDPTYIKE